MNHSFDYLITKIKKYNPNCNFELVEKAYQVASTAHKGQLRESGEPFIIHPLEVAIILASLELECTSIVAGLLHDILEDTDYTIEQIEQNFGSDVAILVDGVTKLEKIPYTTKEEQQVENLRKMFLSMAKDIRVILIKLADRLHNMRTLRYKERQKQVSNARETLEIYAPLAHRLGIFKIKWELEDISLRYLDPDGYYDLVVKIAKKRHQREAYLNKMIENLNYFISKLGIKATVEGRPKHFYSIYSKMKNQNKTIEQIYDLFALRALVDTVYECYAVLGLIHERYKPVPGRFKDYIAMPKPNMYQSLHTTIIGPEGEPIEIQIRTWEMHKIAEVGIAAHWKYKGGNNKSDDELDNKLAWLRQLLEWQKEMRDATEFMETLRIDLFTDEVFVFTPKGDVLSLPAGSCPIDFAYSIHSEVGNKMLGAKVNGKLVQLDYTLQNGDIVEIITSGSVHGPSLYWTKIVKTSQARSKINQWFRKQHKEENITRGKELIEKELKKNSLSFNQIFKQEWVELLLKKYNVNTLEDLYSLVGFGAIPAGKIVSRIREEEKKKNPTAQINIIPIEQPNKNKKKEKSEHGVVVKGIDNCLVRLSRCCNPLPGDAIIGYITKGRGVSVHRKDCVNANKIISECEGKAVDVEWYSSAHAAYLVELVVSAHDRPGLLMEVTNAIAEAKIPLKGLNARTTKEHMGVINIKIEIIDTEQLDKLIKKLRKIRNIVDVSRG